MNGITSQETRRFLLGLTIFLALQILGHSNAAKQQGQITYEAKPSTGSALEKNDASEASSSARQAPAGSSPVLPKEAYPGDLSAFFGGGTSPAAAKKEQTAAVKPQTAQRRSSTASPGSYGERRRARARRPFQGTATSITGQHRNGGNPYLDASASARTDVRVMSDILPGYNGPKGATAAKFMETEAELTYEGAGFLSDRPKSANTKTEGTHSSPSRISQQSLSRNNQETHKHAIQTDNGLPPHLSNMQVSTPADFINTVAHTQAPFYGPLVTEESSHNEQVVRRPSPTSRPYKQTEDLRHESSVNFQTRYPQSNLVPSATSHMGRGGAANHFGIPIQIPPTYSFYPTLGQKGYYVTQESAPGTFLQAERLDSNSGAEFIRYGRVPDHLFQRIKRNVEEDAPVKPNKGAPIKKATATIVKLSLNKYVLDKTEPAESDDKHETKNSSTSAIPTHLEELSKSDSRLESESSEFIPSFGSFPFFGGDHEGINIESASPAHHSGFSGFNLNEESRGHRSGHTYGARPRKRGRGHRGPSYRASESRSFGYGILGSGNFEVLRGGIFTDNRPSASRVPMHQGSESYGGGYDYDDVDDEPIMGFQGYNNFGSLHNALASKKRVSAIIPADRRATASSDHSSSSSQLIETTVDLDAVD